MYKGFKEILDELRQLRRDFRTFAREQEKRWEENWKRWEETNKRFSRIELKLGAISRPRTSNTSGTICAKR